MTRSLLFLPLSSRPFSRVVHGAAPHCPFFHLWLFLSLCLWRLWPLLMLPVRPLDYEMKFVFSRVFCSRERATMLSTLVSLFCSPFFELIVGFFIVRLTVSYHLGSKNGTFSLDIGFQEVGDFQNSTVRVADPGVIVEHPCNLSPSHEPQLAEFCLLLLCESSYESPREGFSSSHWRPSSLVSRCPRELLP